MRSRRTVELLALLLLAAAGCSESRDNESLRRGLEGMENRSAPGDGAPAAPQPEALPDTAGLSVGAGEPDTVPSPPPAPPASAPDTGSPSIQVPEARDVRPWIPEERGRLDDPWTAGARSARSAEGRVAVLRSVRAARNPDFDRTVWEFEGGRLPGYHVEYVDRPVRQCGSGDPVRVEGDAWLVVRLQPAQAHDDRGRSTIGPRAMRPDLTVLRELRLICDFEAEVAWVLGLSRPNRYRVLTLSNPTRLVVDVLH